MKVTSLKELDSYIYSSVILPLSGLDIEPINYFSPVTNDDGHEVTFALKPEQIIGEFQHNFQRDEARKTAKTLVLIALDGQTQMVGADYDNKTHEVRIYGMAFRLCGIQTIVINKIADAFRGHTPFQKVTVLDNMREAERFVQVGRH